MPNETTIRRPTASEVQAYQNQMQCSVLEAQRAVTAELIRRAINSAKTVDDIKPILRSLLEINR
jgi:hypothetical protein